MSLRQHGLVLVRYADDPALWHARLLLLPVGGPGEEDWRYTWVVASPDCDVYAMDLMEDGRFYEDFKVWNFPGLPEGVTRRRAYLPHDGMGDSGMKEIVSLTREAMAVRNEQRATDGLPGRMPEGLMAPPETSWVLMHPLGSEEVGDEVKEAKVVTMLDDVYAQYINENKEQGIVKAMTKKEAETLKAKNTVMPAAAAVVHDDDVRTLPVKFDPAGERWRRVDEAAPLTKEEKFGDFPLEGPRTAGWMLKSLHRSGTYWIGHHERWVKNSGIRGSDRAIHEHRSISRAMQLFVSYD